MSKAPAKSSDATAYPLEPALAFLQRLWALNHALESLSGSMAVRLGITAQQRLVVRCLGRYPGMTAGALAALLHLDPGTISAALRRLEAKGLIERRRDPRDQRRVSLGLTAAGRKLDRPMPGTVESAVESMLASTAPEELDAAERVLSRLASSLEAEVASSAPALARRGKRRNTRVLRR